MNRRLFLKAKFTGQPAESLAGAGVEKFTGQFTKLHAAHLLRRLTFGFPKSKIAEYATLGPEAAVSKILDTKTNLPKPTLPGTEISWLEFPRDGANDPMYIRCIKAWCIQWLATPNPSIL